MNMVTRNRRTRLIGGTLASIIGLVLATSAHAQDAPTTPAPPQEDVAEDAAQPDIVITAQKRSERLQDVPLAVTAVSADTLASKNINDTASLVRAVPALSYQQGNNPTNTGFRIRGIGTQLFGQGFEPSVSVVVDGVVAARGQQGFADLSDIERVEVLRGPQGTLFGKNSTGGAINIVTARPGSTLGGNAQITIAEKGEYRVRGTLTGPLTDTLRARLSGYYNDVGGIFTNVVTGKDWGGLKSYGVNAKLEWDAAPNLTFLAIADYKHTNSECCRPILIKAVNPILAKLYLPVVGSADNRSTAEDSPTYSRYRSQTYSLQGDWDLGAATITSISAYQKFSHVNNVDVDGINTAVPVFVGATGGANYSAWNVNRGTVDLRNFTQELRIASSGSRKFTYVAGVYYSTLDIARDFQRRRAFCAAGTAAQIGTPCTPTRWESQYYNASFSNDSIALFGQIEWEFVSKLKLIAGIRGEHLTVSNTGSRPGLPMVAGDVLWPGGQANSGTKRASDDALSGRAGLQYQFSRDAQIYATYSHGYKAPGYGTEITTDFATQPLVNPETVNAYEVGFKGSTPDRTFSIGIAAFLAKYRDLQVQTTVNDPLAGPVARTTNAGSSETKGIEIEATLRPAKGLSINAAFSYVKATIDIDGFDCPLTLQAGTLPTVNVTTGTPPINQCYRPQFGTTIGAPLINLRGATLPSAPRYRVQLSPQYQHELGTNLVLLGQVDVNFQSAQSQAIADPLLRQKAYALVDASIGLRTADSKYSLRVFVRNLFDTTYFSDLTHGSVLASAANPYDLFAQIPKDADRFFGATLGVKF